jgi:hypothetical protein
MQSVDFGKAKTTIEWPPALLPWKGYCATSRLLKGANHEIQLPGLRGREAVGRDVR